VVAHYVLLRGGEVLAQRGVLPAALSLQIPTLALSLIAIGLVVLQARRGAGAIR
jgi:lipopolysaccharide export system permease protein